MPNVIGCIDGTSILIRTPANKVYRTYKYVRNRLPLNINSAYKLAIPILYCVSIH